MISITKEGCIMMYTQTGKSIKDFKDSVFNIVIDLMFTLCMRRDFIISIMIVVVIIIIL